MEISRIDIEINELFATLKNSSIPTVLVEGNDDMIFYRRVEEELLVTHCLQSSHAPPMGLQAPTS